MGTNPNQVSAGGQASASSASDPKVKQLAGVAQEQVGKVAEQVKSRIGDQLQNAVSRLGNQVQSASDDLRVIGKTLQEQNRHGLARLTNQAADNADQLFLYLSRSDANQVLNELRQAAQRKPWPTAGACFALGLVGSRLVKNSISSDKSKEVSDGR